MGAQRHVEPGVGGEPTRVEVVQRLAGEAPAQETAHVRAEVVDARERHVQLGVQVGREAFEVGGDVPGGHGHAVALDAGRARAREHERAARDPVAPVAPRDPLGPLQVVGVVPVGVGMAPGLHPVGPVGGVTGGVDGVVHLGLAQVDPLPQHAVLDEGLALQVVPVVGGRVQGPVDHPAAAPPVVCVDVAHAVQVDGGAVCATRADEEAPGGEVGVLRQSPGDVGLLDR